MGYNPRRHRLPVCNAFGILLVDKPADWTSFDVVNFVRGRFNLPKVGHCGTLDPAATGLLVLTVGKFTSFSSRFSGDDKTYLTAIHRGEVNMFFLDGSVAGMDGEVLATTNIDYPKADNSEAVKITSSLVLSK